MTFPITETGRKRGLTAETRPSQNSATMKTGSQSEDWTPPDPRTGGSAVWDDMGRRNELLPPHLFSNEPAPHETYRDWTTFTDNPQRPRPGPESPALASVIHSKCAGWPQTPTTEELYNALHTRTPTTRQRALIRTWWVEATFDQIIEAWAQRAYTIRDLVRSVHLAGCARTEVPYLAQRMRTINFWGDTER